MIPRTSQAIDQTVASIQTLDLDPLKVKLMASEEGSGWSRAKADQVETEYRRFLILVAKYPQQTIAPHQDVDQFWHAHILDTLKYAQDCESVFGYFLHHFPYFGMRGADDAANLTRAAHTTAQLYEAEFGAAAANDAGYCGATSQVSGAAQTAYCGKANAVAYCGKAAASAYCGKVNAVAYCGRQATGTEAHPDVMRTAIRPSLQR